MNFKVIPAESIAAFKDGILSSILQFFNCWPHAKEFVNNLAWRMDLHVSALPFLRLIPKLNSETKSSEARRSEQVIAPRLQAIDSAARCRFQYRT